MAGRFPLYHFEFGKICQAVKSFEDSPDSDQGRWDAATAKLTDREVRERAQAVLIASVAARACRATLSIRTQELLGPHIPESFLIEVYPRRKAFYDREYPTEVSEIKSALGRSSPDYWDFQGMTTAALFAADPSSFRQRKLAK